MLVNTVEHRGSAEERCLITQRMFDFEGDDMKVATERTKRALFYQDDEEELVSRESLLGCFAVLEIHVTDYVPDDPDYEQREVRYE